MVILFQQRNKHKQYILYYNIIITKKQAECYGISTHPIFFWCLCGGVCVCVRGGGQGERGTKDKNGVCQNSVISGLVAFFLSLSVSFLAMSGGICRSLSF